MAFKRVFYLWIAGPEKMKQLLRTVYNVPRHPEESHVNYLDDKYNYIKCNVRSTDLHSHASRHALCD